MLFLPDKIIKELKKNNFKDSSIKTYSGSMKRIFRDIFNSDKYSKTSLTEFDKIKKHIDKIENVGIRKSLIATILRIGKVESLPKKLIDEYEEYFKDIIREYDDKNIYKSASKKDLDKKEKVGSIKDLCKKRDEYLKNAQESKKDRDWIKYLVACLYTLLPPLRQDEYIDMYIVSLPIIKKDEDEKKFYKEYCSAMKNNFIDMENNKIIIYKSKTKKNFNVRIFDLPDELKKAIRLVRKEMNEKSKKLLNGQMFNTQPGFTGFLTTTLGASSSMLRKLYISELMSQFQTREEIKNPINIEKRKKIAYIMGHSITTATQIYDRFL